MFDSLVGLVRDYYGQADTVGLHEPRLGMNEKRALMEAIESGMVSSIGPFVDQMERMVEEYTGANHAIATVNGTSALHASLLLAGVAKDDLVITQSLSFVATCNAIHYCGARPAFVDIDRSTLSMSPQALSEFLDSQTEMRDDGLCWHCETGRCIRACMPMHTFGFPAAILDIEALCRSYGIVLVEDSAEALGSFYSASHCGTAGKVGALSFNGNKILTTGGGGMILTNDPQMAERALHITTTARISVTPCLSHDEVGYNYRMPNINAALGVAQFASLPEFLQSKRDLARLYRDWGLTTGRDMIVEAPGTRANHWLNALVCASVDERNQLLTYTQDRGIATRAVWEPMHRLPMYSNCTRDQLQHTEWAASHVVTLPSGVPQARKPDKSRCELSN